MYIITDNDGHKLYLPTRMAQAYFEPMISSCKVANQKFLEDNYPVTPTMAITGSFIYAHPLSYRGINALHYSKRNWQCVLNRIKKLGMDTVILQAAVWSELGECYYPSRHFAGYNTWNVIEPMLEAARELDLCVFLGGYSSVEEWKEKVDTAIMDEERQNQKICYRELLDYSDLFDGFYFAPETSYSGKRDTKSERFLNTLYREFFLEVKEHAPDMKILMSPDTRFFPDKKTDIEDSWCSLLDGVPLDIIAPYDSIGSCGNQLCWQDEAYRVWSNVCRNFGVPLWAGVELFERYDRVEGDSFYYTASPERVVAQINNAAPYVEKLLCWEAPYYLNPDLGNRNKMLRDYLLRRRGWR